MIKVLHFYKTYLPDTVGGVEQVINQLIRAAVPFGVTSEVLSLSSDSTLGIVTVDGHQVHRAKLDFSISSTSFSASVFSLFSKLAKDADIIHYHYPWPFMDLVHFFTRHKKPTVVTYHSDIVKQKNMLKLYRPLKQLFLADVSRIVATSPKGTRAPLGVSMIRLRN